tara:strand:- start:233 stop:763 length:531 start_codon:yes stop_codon:yes gene_type:complete
MIVTFWLIVLAIALFVIIRQLTKNKEYQVKKIKKEYQIQEGKIHYTDLDKPTKALFSYKTGLVGKPDYIVKQGQTHIPVEIKKGNHNNPFKSHIMQLIAYCYLVEEKYKTKVPYGVLIYEDYQTKIPYTETEKKELLEVMEIMRTQKEFSRNHNSINKCRICGFGSICNDNLINVL